MSDDADRSLKTRAADFLFTQPPSVVILFLFVALLVSAIWYAVHDVKAMVPILVQQIQDGYGTQEAAQTEQIKAIHADRMEERQWHREMLKEHRAGLPKDVKPFAAN